MESQTTIPLTAWATWHLNFPVCLHLTLPSAQPQYLVICHEETQQSGSQDPWCVISFFVSSTQSSSVSNSKLLLKMASGYNSLKCSYQQTQKSVSLSPNLPVVLKAFQKCVLVQSLELPGHLYQRHLDYLEDKASALKPYFKIEKGIFFNFIYWKDLSLSVLRIYWLWTWPSTFRLSSALPHHGNLSLCQYLTVLTWLA